MHEAASTRIPAFLRIRYGGTNDAKQTLGPIGDIRNAFIGTQQYLYKGDGPGRLL